MDRIDIRLSVNRVSRQKLLVTESSPVTTAIAREMVEMARLARFARWGATVPKPGELRNGKFRLSSAITAPLDAALDRGAISMRGYDRVLRIAWTVADLDGANSPGKQQIGKAIFLRQGV
jgi:magnesium chelatase family protein